jgi:hypothetical protein
MMKKWTNYFKSNKNENLMKKLWIGFSLSGFSRYKAMKQVDWEDFVSISSDRLEFDFENLKIRDTKKEVQRKKTIVVYGDQRSYRDLVVYLK